MEEVFMTHRNTETDLMKLKQILLTAGGKGFTITCTAHESAYPSACPIPLKKSVLKLISGRSVGWCAASGAS
jgi:hypothetical protein